MLLLPESSALESAQESNDSNLVPSVSDKRTFLKSRRLKRACLGGMCGITGLLQGIGRGLSSLLPMPGMMEPPFLPVPYRRRRKRQFGCCMLVSVFSGKYFEKKGFCFQRIYPLWKYLVPCMLPGLCVLRRCGTKTRHPAASLSKLPFKIKSAAKNTFEKNNFEKYFWKKKLTTRP